MRNGENCKDALIIEPDQNHSDLNLYTELVISTLCMFLCDSQALSDSTDFKINL